MLLDRTAQANARPELEIYADDVKCAHGCAWASWTPTGCSIWPRAGSPARAKALMLQAFIAEALTGRAKPTICAQARPLEACCERGNLTLDLAKSAAIFRGWQVAGTIWTAAPPRKSRRP
jgi:hypothetical protein